MRWTDAAVRAALGLGPAILERDADEASAGEPRGADAVGCNSAVAYSAVSTDTRTLAPGALFVALAGEHFDAHEFLAAAAAAGARGAVVTHVPGSAPAGLVYYVVPDTLDALGRLARYRRRRLAAPVCAITGSAGKTTTKELARAVLGERYRVHATRGNLNNLVGGPLTLLSTPEDAEAVVVEVGTNAPGEIARLRDVVEPDVAIITSVAEAHLEGLGTLEGVLREKTSLLSGLGPDGLALVADSPSSLPERARALAAHVRVAGMSERADADLRATDVRLDEEGRARFLWRGREVRLGHRGAHNVTSALLALALAESWGVATEAAVAAVARPAAGAMRGELRRYGTLRVLVDCYNANPPSVDAAVALLTALPRGSGRVAVLGTMKELGSESARLHRQVAASVGAADLDLVVATGEFVDAFEPLRAEMGERLIAVADPLAAAAPLTRRLTGDEVVLLKASRGVALERLLPELEARFGAAAAVAGQGGGR